MLSESGDLTWIDNFFCQRNCKSATISRTEHLHDTQQFRGKLNSVLSFEDSKSSRVPANDLRNVVAPESLSPILPVKSLNDFHMNIVRNALHHGRSASLEGGDLLVCLNIRPIIPCWDDEFRVDKVAKPELPVVEPVRRIAHIFSELQILLSSTETLCVSRFRNANFPCDPSRFVNHLDPVTYQV